MGNIVAELIVSRMADGELTRLNELLLEELETLMKSDGLGVAAGRDLIRRASMVVSAEVGRRSRAGRRT